MRVLPQTTGGDGHAAVLLKHIREAIDASFPGMDLSVEPNKETHNTVFSIGNDRSVEVTEAFLDAAEGLTSALYSLASLRTHLRRLETGDVLMVTRYGLRMIFSDKTA